MSTDTDSTDSSTDSSNQLYRQVAHRLFATEYNDSTHTFKEGDDERSPKFALTPTGYAMNRAFFVGTITETKDVGNDGEYWQARVVDPTGVFYVYAGQYQPEAAAFIRNCNPPEYVAVLGKPNTYERDNGDINVSVRPERITAVNADCRDRWLTETADRTMDRIVAFKNGQSPRFDEAVERYDTGIDDYINAVEEALDSLEIEV